MARTIDMHAHLDPRMLDVERMIAKMDAAGVDRIAIIPCMNDPLPETPERLLSGMRYLMQRGWGRPVANAMHRATLTGKGNLRLTSGVYEIYPTPDNQPVADLVSARPDRFWGWIFLNPRAQPNVLEQLEKWRSVPGMIGVKVHPHWHDYATDLLDPLLRRCAELRLPVLAHLGFGRRGDFRAIAQRHPKLVLIAAHGGFPCYADLWSYKSEAPNLYVDLSSPYLNEEVARAAVGAMGVERCLYGTDAPYGFHGADGTYDYGAIKGWISRMPISDAGREKILAGNFERLLDG